MPPTPPPVPSVSRYAPVRKSAYEDLRAFFMLIFRISLINNFKSNSFSKNLNTKTICSNYC